MCTDRAALTANRVCMCRSRGCQQRGAASDVAGVWGLARPVARSLGRAGPRAVLVPESVCPGACISTCTGVPPPPQARLINHAVSVRSALSGAQAASQLSGKVTAAKPNWAKLTMAGSSENMETCLTPTMYFRYPLRMHVHCGSPYAVNEAAVLLQHMSSLPFAASPPTSKLPASLPMEGHIWSGDTIVSTCTSVPSV